MQQNPFEPNASPHSYTPPIPAPEPLQQTLTAGGGDWQSAPPIVRSWAYTLAFLGMIGGGFVMVAGAFMPNDRIGGLVGGILIGAILFAVSFWQRKAIRRGDRNAWTVQIILSALGLTSFPIGTLIHGYVLMNWFKPEVKAWFGIR
jgi:hypothetical protein